MSSSFGQHRHSLTLRNSRVINLRKLSPKARSPGSVSHDSHRRWFSPSESGPRFPLQDLAGSEGAFRIHMADERADDV